MPMELKLSPKRRKKIEGVLRRGDKE
jgi:hypothetical protein